MRLVLLAVVLGVTVVAGPVLAGPGLVEPPWTVWKREGVFDDSSISHPAIALRPDGAPVVSFGAYAGAYVATQELGYWTSSHLGNYLASRGGIAVDASGTAHVSLKRAQDGKLAYAKGFGGTWSIITFAYTTDSGDHPIAVSPSGQPHIAFRQAGSTVYYATVDPVTKQPRVEFVGGGGVADNTLDIAIDSSGSPHIIYGRGASLELIYASRNSTGTWTKEVAHSQCGSMSSLAIGNDRPQVSCQSARWADWGLGLTWVYHDGSQWLSEIVDDRGGDVISRSEWFVGLFTDIALDEDANPHISYWVGDPGLTSPSQLHYATRTSGDWHIETVDRISRYNGAGSGVAVDACGRPRIAYPTPYTVFSSAEPGATLSYAEPFFPLC